MSIPFIDLKTQFHNNRDKITAAVTNVLEHGQYIMGPEIQELESSLADYIGVKYAVACSSGTDALLMPLMALNLSAEDAIFTSPFTFFASAEAISLAGATPVFVDIDPDTYNMDPDQLERQIERINREGKLNPRGIMPVDLFGLAADYSRISEIAKRNNLFLLEDAAQSFGADYHGKKAAGFGDAGATSFYPAKPLGGYGDSGAVFTNNDELYQTLISLRVHGQAQSGDKYDNVRIGINGRMDSIQAAVLLQKLSLYDTELTQRDEVANLYTSELQGSVKTPLVPDGQSCVWAQYSIQVEDRAAIQQALKAVGVPTAVFYPIPIHLCTAYQHLQHKPGDFPCSEHAARHILSLPMHPYLDEQQINLITATIKSNL